MEKYLTLGSIQSAEWVDRKSRFIGTASPVQEEEEALAFLREIRDRYKDANHHCYAYIIGANEGIMRYSDDGEPGGTAGMPILSVLRARHVVYAAVVVTRYFGGTLLGAGGLVRAYSQTSALAVNAAQVVCIEPTVTLLVEVAYPLWDSLSHALKSAPVQQVGVEYSTTVVVTLRVRERDEKVLLALLDWVTDGRSETLELERGYHRWAVDEGS